MFSRFVLSLSVLLLFVPAEALAGRIVVNHDEWTTSDTGFFNVGLSAETFVQNVANFFLGGGGTGNFLVYSTNFSLNESSFSSTLTTAGHSLTVSTAITFDLPTLLTYDGVFLAGAPGANNTVLAAYVNAGGGVYLAGGTGGGATAEADMWNPFLNTFGLSLVGGAYNGVSGSIAVTGTHPILNGVSNLFYDNGNTVVLFGSNPNAQIIESSGQAGLIGVFEGESRVAPVPEPSTWTLLAIGLGALAVRRRLKRSNRRR